MLSFPRICVHSCDFSLIYEPTILVDCATTVSVCGLGIRVEVIPYLLIPTNSCIRFYLFLTSHRVLIVANPGIGIGSFKGDFFVLPFCISNVEFEVKM